MAGLCLFLHSPSPALYPHWAPPQGLCVLILGWVAAQTSRTQSQSPQVETTLWGPAPHASPDPGLGLCHLQALCGAPSPAPNTPAALAKPVLSSTIGWAALSSAFATVCLAISLTGPRASPPCSPTMPSALSGPGTLSLSQGAAIEVLCPGLSLPLQTRL